MKPSLLGKLVPWGITLVVLIGAGWVVANRPKPPSPPDQPETRGLSQLEPKSKLWVLMICDASDPTLKRGVMIDRERIQEWIHGNVPASRWHIELLNEPFTPAVTADVAKFFKNPFQRDDTILVYYSGHGAVDSDGPYMALGYDREKQSSVVKLRHRELSEQILACEVRLGLLITDCCSNVMPNEAGANLMVGRGGKREATDLSPMADKLFFKSRGAIGLTAATTSEAYSHPSTGGLFTTALCMASESRQVSDSWLDLHGRISQETKELYEKLVKRAQVLPAKNGGSPQVPHLYDLRELERTKQSFAVVQLFNDSQGPVTLTYRWVGSENRSVRLEPRQKTTLFRPTTAGRADDWEFVVEFQNEHESWELSGVRTPTVWTGDREPTNADLIGTTYHLWTPTEP